MKRVVGHVLVYLAGSVAVVAMEHREVWQKYGGGRGGFGVSACTRFWEAEYTNMYMSAKLIPLKREDLQVIVDSLNENDQ